MPSNSRRQQRFQELGLLDVPEPTNPLADIGISTELASTLLSEDPTGKRLKTVTNGMAKILARTYHPDVPETGSRERWGQIDFADRRIDTADATALQRWAKGERSSNSSIQVDKMREQQANVITRASSVFLENLRYSHHPEHYAQLPWAQGILLERDHSVILGRLLASGGLRSLRGMSSGNNKSTAPKDQSQSFGFDGFMRQHESFGIEPGTPITTYVDERGRASILGDGLHFMMDISGPVAAHRSARSKLSIHQKQEVGTSDFWTRSKDPILFHSTVPEQTSRTDRSVPITRFATWIGTAHASQSMVRDTPLEVVGSTSDHDFYNRLRHSKNAGAAAILGASAAAEVSYFNIIGVQAEQFIEKESGYTPLLKPGNALLLYDPHSELPVITDAIILGMIGSDPHAE